MRVSLIITAAGSGVRFRQSYSASEPSAQPAPNKPKVFLELGGVAVLERSLFAFDQIPEIKETFVTVSPDFRGQALAWGKARGMKKVKWVVGGKTRAESVLNALKKTSPKNLWVMVHDAARPLIQPSTIRKLLKQTSKAEGVLLAKQVVSTLKKISKLGHQVEGTIDRSQLAEAETPQLINRTFLFQAYDQVPNALAYTDESGLVEAAGGRMKVLLHNDWNPKLTHYADYELAQAKMNSKAEFRIGNGYDIHRLVKGRKLWIGGVRVPFEKGSLGHSDGDALLHSIADAILGALGLGDIGDWFSDQDVRYKNIQSSKLLTQVLKKSKLLGWRPFQVDANVILEKPKLGPVKVKVRQSVATLLKLPLDRVSVKARTYEGLPPIGTGEAWVCQTVVMMKRG